jgi:hypothetical protein
VVIFLRDGIELLPLLRFIESSCLREAGVEKEEEEYIARRYDIDSRTGTGTGEVTRGRMAVALAAFFIFTNPQSILKRHTSFSRRKADVSFCTSPVLGLIALPSIDPLLYMYL